MYKPEPTEISAALQELKKRWKNVSDARHQTWSGHFSGLMTFINENPYLADIIQREEQNNPVNFNDWWDEFQATGGSFVGSKHYSIPSDSSTKAILFYHFLKAVEAGTVNLDQFCVDAYGLSNYQEMTETVNREIVSHVVEEMERQLIDVRATASSAPI
jgi:hypothetical protein